MDTPPLHRGLLARPRARRRAASLLALALLGGGSLAGVGAASATQRPLADAATCPQTVHIAPSVSWPSPSWKSCYTGTITQSSPTVATWRNETILAVGDEHGVVHVLNAATGQELRGWPQAMAGGPGQRIAIESSPAIAYLDGPSRPPSIIVGSGSTWVPDSVGEVEAFTLSGRRRWLFHVGRAAGTAVGVISSPAVGDVVGNGQQQVVFGSWDHKIYVLDRRGHQLGFAYDNADTIWSSPALYRLPGRRAADVFLGSDASGRPTRGAPNGKCVGGFIADYRFAARAVDPDTNRVGPGLDRVWFHCENQSVWSSPAIGVINATGRPAVVVGTSYYEQPFPSGTNRLYAFYAGTGAPVPGWPVTTSGPAVGSPAIGVIDSSGRPAVVDTSWVCAGAQQSTCISPNVSKVSAWSGSGHPLWSQTLRGPADWASPILTPLGAHAWNDVLVGSSYGLYPLGGPDGAYLYGTQLANQWAAINPACRVFSTASVANVAGSGAGSGWHVFESCGGPPSFHAPGEIAAYPLPVTLSQQPGWPMFRDSPDHLGALAKSAP